MSNYRRADLDSVLTMKLTTTTTPSYAIPSSEEWEEGLRDCFELETSKHWEDLFDEYAPERPLPGDDTGGKETWDRRRPWARCLAVARLNGARSVVVERRYVDRDYRSEFAALYAHVLAPIADTTHRLHFFSLPKSGLALHLVDKADQEHVSKLQDAYLGYVVCRPKPLERVGRTMLLPPKYASVRTAVEERVNFFGVELRATGVPFMQQDHRLGVCAHVAVWTMLYSAYRCKDAALKTIADVVEHCHGMPDGRLGLDDSEVVSALHSAGLRPQMYEVGHDLPVVRHYPWTSDKKRDHKPVDTNSPFFHEAAGEADLERRIAETILPCLNSGIPVYASSSSHAFVICGYSTRESTDRAGDTSSIEYTVHDDQVGPYIRVFSPMRDFRALRNAQVPSDFTDEALKTATHVYAAAASDQLVEHYPPDPKAKKERTKDELTKTVIEDRRDWHGLVLPLPGNVHISFSAAERYAAQIFDIRIKVLARKSDLVQSDADEVKPSGNFRLNELRKTDGLSLRTYLVKSPEFRRQLESRFVPLEVAQVYRKSRFAANVHVVELLHQARPSNKPRVIGEVIIDSTSGDTHPWRHAVRIGHSFEIVRSDGALLVPETGSTDFGYSMTGFPGRRNARGRSPLGS